MAAFGETIYIPQRPITCPSRLISYSDPALFRKPTLADAAGALWRAR